jgi:DNA-binding transcriptional MerR regulator
VTARLHDSDRGIQIPAKRYRIGELVRYSPFSRQTIHNYTIMGLIREAEWTEGGHRLYDESVFERLSLIVEMKKTKTLTEIRRILREEDRVSSSALPSQRTAFHHRQTARDSHGHLDSGRGAEGEN